MLKKIQNHVSAFDRYFREADGDDNKVSVKVAPRANRGTDYNNDVNSVKVAPRANRGTDYSTEEDTDETETSPTTPDTGDGETDYTSDQNTDNQTDTGNDDTGNEDSTANDTSDDTNEGSPDEPDTGDGETDYTQDDGGEDNTEDTDNDANNDENNEEDEKSKDDKLKKYHMYSKFMKLYSLLENYIEKIRNIVKDDPDQNAVIKVVVNNLSDLYDNLFDFMTIAYRQSTYVQVLLYYETAISTIKLNFELIRNNNIKLKQ